MPPSRPPPNQISGSCLCGGISYTLSFPQESTPWPPTVQSCQCTMCRKNTGALLPIFLVLDPAKGQIMPWPLNSGDENSTYTEYASSEKGLRGFCSKCGSTLLWRARNGNQEKTIDLFVGTLDERWLVEEREVARALATPNDVQLWCGHAVQGVTDGVEGGRKMRSVRGTEMD